MRKHDESYRLLFSEPRMVIELTSFTMERSAGGRRSSWPT
jgi:hypothetical protein